ncbi:MAG TPA: glycoside hydrolase family 15 protein [Usitatibacter sp.]|nr:glycoside hydrolase family 15 protein [Usitatibacter sp.]
MRGYRPIEDYAAIGDCHGSALVARDGSIDWCCFGRFDAPPVFWRILDAERGGFLAIAPTADFEATRAYLPGTNVLRTEFRTAAGRVAITDFMPLGRAPDARANDYVRVVAPGWLVRRIEGIAGSVELGVSSRVTSGFAVDDAAPRDAGLAIHGVPPGLVRVAAGERRFVAIAPAADRVTGEAIDALFEATCAYWREWIGYCRYDGPYAAQVERSALVLKMMTYPPTGACVAALTTSLPEEIGGERNWDYRFCWIRDASLMLLALSALGYSGESRGFWNYLCELLEGGVEHLQVMYGIGREAHLEERCVDLDGYRGSRPVRTGNAAHEQNQTDLYGYILEGALGYRLLGGAFNPGDAESLAAVADFVEGCWSLPDTGIWEPRGPPRHFVHSKAMCWIVLDRAIRLLGHRPQWAQLRERIWNEILARGRDAEGGHLLQAFDAKGDEVDAALLQLATLGVPLDVQTIHRTRLVVERVLRRGDFIERYRTPDGVAGGEGAFLVCSFWHVDSLLAEGKRDAAVALFERLLAIANDVGLYSEEYDPRGSFLGNVPQAFTHLGLVNTAVSLALFDRHGPGAVRAGHAERARLHVKATFGWRGIAAALASTGRVRLRSSRASRIDLARLGIRG